MTDPSRTYQELYEENTLLKQRIAELIASESKRNMADEALLESEEKFRSIFENAREGIFQTTPDGHYISINSTLAHMFGYDSPEDMMSSELDIGRQLYVNQKQRKEYIRLLDEKGVINNYEAQMRRKDGNIFWVSINTQVVRNGVGNPLYFEGFVVDITERKHAEEELKKSEELEKSILKSVPYGLAGAENRTIFFANSAMEDVFGWKPEELIGKSTRILFRNEDEWKEYGANLYSWLRKKPLVTFDSNIPFVRKDGKEIRCRNSVSRIGEELGITNRVVTTFEDISDRIQSEKVLLESEERYRMIFNHSPLGIIHFDSKGVIRDCNEKFAQIMGTSKGKIIGFNLIERMHDPAMIKAIKNALGGILSYYEGDYLSVTGGKSTHLRAIYQSIITDDAIFLGAVGIFEDITEHKRVEEALRLQEMQLRTILESTCDGILAVDNAGRLIKANQKFIDLWKIPSGLLEKGSDEALLAYVLGQLVHPEAFLNKINALYASTAVDFDTILFKDGRIIERYSCPLLSEGVINGRVWSFRDITERKRTEESLRLITDSMSDMVRVTDLKGVNLYSSPSHAKILGYKPEERVGKSTFDIVHPDDVEYLFKVYTEGIVNKKPAKAEYRIKHAEGHYIWLESTADGIFDDQGEVTAVIISSRDITDRKRAEEAIAHSHNLMRYIIEHNQSAVAVHDRDLKYIYVSQQYLRDYGVKEEDVIGKHHYDVFPDLPQKWRDVHQKALTGEISSAEDDPYEREDGTVDWTRWECRPWYEANGSIGGIIIYTEIITKRKKTEVELKETLDSLRKAFGAIVQVMVSVVESRDPYTSGHQIRSADLARAIAMEMGLPQNKIDGIRMAGSIHDIGKLSIPAEILSKPTKLHEIEFRLIKEHTRTGYEMLKDVESPWPLAEIVYQHHERMDGSGYPRHLKGEEICMEARIMAVADVVEAMASHRPYRPSLGIDAALDEIEKNRGIFYDEAVVDACLRLFREKGFKLEGA